MPPINPDPIGLPTFRPQFPPRLEDMRIIAEQSRQAMDSAAWGTGADLGGGAGGLQIPGELLPDGFWARLTTPANVDGLYSFVEVEDDGTGYGWTTSDAPMLGDDLACELNNNTRIPVPGPPTSLSASGGGSSSLLYYVVTAIWTDYLGNTWDSDISDEVTVDGGASVSLSWSEPSPIIAPSTTAAQYVVTGYKVWRGTSPDGEDVLVTTISGASTTTYTDTGGGTAGSPVLGGTAGPVVWMSPRSSWDYFRFFYSAQPLPLAWIKPTTSSSSTITLPGGSTISGYSADVDSWSNTSGSWSDGATVWWFGANGETPTSGTRYQCRLLGIDKNGVAIWSTVPPSVSLSNMSSTLASNYTLTTSWANSGMSLTLPANSTWLLQAQLTGSITSSSTGAGDSVSCRFYDGSSLAGQPVEFCNAICDSVSFTDAGSLTAIYTAGASGATIELQAILNSGNLSAAVLITGTSLSSPAGCYMAGIRLS